jgi:hypothetical protein
MSLLTQNLHLLHSVLINVKIYILSNDLIYVSVHDESHPELGNLFQGDIILAEGRNALLVEEYLWPKGVVPYVFHSNYSKLLLKNQHQRKEWLLLVFHFYSSIKFDMIQYNTIPHTRQFGSIAILK